MAYSRNYLIHYYEINKKKKLTIPTLLHYFEDIAILNSEANGFSLDYYDETNTGFMLIKWDITVRSWPKFNELITLNTQPTSFKRFLANRNYNIVAQDGEKIIEAKSVWLFADIKTRRPVRVPNEILTGFNIAPEAEKLFEILDDLQAVQSGAYTLKIKTQTFDIDTNDHVNNVRYVEWALVSLPPEHLQNYSAQRIIVNYKKELHLDEEAEVISDVIEDEGKIISVHSIFSDGKEICHLKFEWVKD
jgi:medium-chain acyl-[acyl-carrier-protein] hydrolase